MTSRFDQKGWYFMNDPPWENPQFMPDYPWKKLPQEQQRQLYEDMMTKAKKTVAKEAPKTMKIYLGFNKIDEFWDVYENKKDAEHNCSVFVEVIVPDLTSTARKGTCVGQWELELVEA